MQQQKVIMITGASKGLGKALALHLAGKDHKLAICARNEEELKQVENEIHRRGAKIVAAVADVSNKKDVERFVSITENTFGKIDVLINNASAFGPGPTYLADYSDEAFEDVILSNITNPFYMTKRVLPGMLARQRGTIISITSEVGITGYAEWGAYSVSKYALEGLAAVWADELRHTGVQMVLVDPGEMDTIMHKIAVPDCNYSLSSPEEIARALESVVLDETMSLNGKRFEAQDLIEEGHHDD
ncbi:3-oxoacyl-ACP reductase [Alkalihalophilus pseudofirmus]|uniref:SDR family NAD(P)-dependent oxidoreductase n=1 Tax=Alkalihalophilus pseudofirmus TaxID=79885 RepID=UPI00095153DF|nr:3-oxoacyl-ACP reductase [Alkalihalophilus pseudofirmus]